MLVLGITKVYNLLINCLDKIRTISLKYREDFLKELDYSSLQQFTLLKSLVVVLIMLI